MFPSEFLDEKYDICPKCKSKCEIIFCGPYSQTWKCTNKKCNYKIIDNN
jgi:hypothetical protein